MIGDEPSFGFASCYCMMCQRPGNGHAYLLVDEVGTVVSDRPPGVAERMGLSAEGVLDWMLASLRVSMLKAQQPYHTLSHQGVPNV